MDQDLQGSTLKPRGLRLWRTELYHSTHSVFITGKWAGEWKDWEKDIRSYAFEMFTFSRWSFVCHVQELLRSKKRKFRLISENSYFLCSMWRIWIFQVGREKKIISAPPDSKITTMSVSFQLFLNLYLHSVMNWMILCVLLLLLDDDINIFPNHQTFRNITTRWELCWTHQLLNRVHTLLPWHLEIFIVLVYQHNRWGYEVKD